MVAACKEFLVYPGNMLQLLDLIVLATTIEQHRKFAIESFNLVFQVDIRGTVQSVAQVIDVGEKCINDEAPPGDEMIVGVFEGVQLLLDFVKMGNRVKRQQDQIKIAFMFELIIAHI